MIPKLYVIVRDDLTVGSKVAQGIHAVRQFVDEHPQEDQAWYRDSNTIVVLKVPDS